MNLDNTIQALRQNRKGVRFDELVKICDHYFWRSSAEGDQPSDLPDAVAGRPKGEHSRPQWHG